MSGSWTELDLAIEQVAYKFLHRLVGVLQTGGQTFKFYIVHGELREGNMGINNQSGESLVFDTGSYDACNEMALGH
jgi:protein-ribulosamine 3-kinase